MAQRLLELGDLGELELDGRLAAEDVDEDLELELVLVDLDAPAGEVGAGAFLDPDGLAHLVLEAGLGPGGDLFGDPCGHGAERIQAPPRQSSKETRVGNECVRPLESLWATA